MAGNTTPHRPKNIFNNVALAPKLMDILADYQDPFSGARLICAALPAFYAPIFGMGSKEDLKREFFFVSGWVPAWRNRIIAGAFYKSEKGAINNFLRRKDKAILPLHLDFNRDWQRSRVYRWEERNGSKCNSILDINRMKEVVDNVSRDFGMTPPTVTYIKPRPNIQEYSYYFHKEHHIEMRDAHYATLLHEIAHAIDYRINRNNTLVYHGPSFLRTLLCVAEIYRFMNPDRMEQSVKAAQLQIAPLYNFPELEKRMFLFRQKKQAYFTLPWTLR